MKKILLSSLLFLSVLLILSMSSVSAVEHQVVKESIIEKYQEKIHELKDTLEPPSPLSFLIGVILMIIGFALLGIGVILKLICMILSSDIPIPFFDD